MSSEKHYNNCFPATCAAPSALFTLLVSIVEGKRGTFWRGNTAIKLDNFVER